MNAIMMRHAFVHCVSVIVAGDLSFGSTRLGEHGEWFKTTPKSGRPCATRLGEGNGASFDQANAPGG